MYNRHQAAINNPVNGALRLNLVQNPAVPTEASKMEAFLAEHQNSMRPVLSQLRNQFEFDSALHAEHTFKRLSGEALNGRFDRADQILSCIKKVRTRGNIRFNSECVNNTNFSEYFYFKKVVGEVVAKADKLPKPSNLLGNGFDKSKSVELVNDSVILNSSTPFNEFSGYNQAINLFIKNLGLNKTHKDFLDAFSVLAASELFPHYVAVAAIDETILYGVGAGLSTKVFWYLYKNQALAQFLTDATIRLPGPPTSGLIGSGTNYYMDIKTLVLGTMSVLAIGGTLKLLLGPAASTPKELFIKP